MPVKIWYEDLPGAFGPNEYYKVWPSGGMVPEERLNTYVRLCIYIGLLLAIASADARWLFIGIFAMLFTAAAYQHMEYNRSVGEQFLASRNLAIVDNQVCTRPTVNNPFMNPSPADFAEDPTRPSACPVEDPAVAEAVDAGFYARLFQDVGDLYGTYASQRQYYTVPNTRMANDQTGFAKWLFGRGPSCKDGDGMQCFRNVSFPQYGH